MGGREWEGELGCPETPLSGGSCFLISSSLVCVGRGALSKAWYWGKPPVYFRLGSHPSLLGSARRGCRECTHPEGTPKLAWWWWEEHIPTQSWNRLEQSSLRWPQLKQGWEVGGVR